MRLTSPPTSYQLPNPSATQQLLAQQPQPIAMTVQLPEPPPAAEAPPPHPLAYLPAALVGAFAVAATWWMARENLRTARDKLKFDMLDRRLDIYQALVDMQYKFRTIKQITDEDYLKVKKDIATAHWIFDKERLQVVDDFLGYIKTYRQEHQQWHGSVKQNNKKRMDEAMHKREEALRNATRVDLESAFRAVLHVRE